MGHSLNMEHRFFSRTGFLLWVAATASVVLLQPYVLALTPGAFAAAIKETQLSLGVLLVISVIQSSLFLCGMIFTGLWAARKLGLGAPVIEAWVNHTVPPPRLRFRVLTAGSLGVIAGMLIIGLEYGLFIPLDASGVGEIQDKHPAAWKGLLASFYGGIAEELQLRLFLLSLLALAWASLLKRVRGSNELLFSNRMFWVVNIFVALVFGLAHLPATAELLPLTPLVVVRAILLNGIVAIIAGYLYWKNGIEMAIVMHFSADIVLHVLLPLFIL